MEIPLIKLQSFSWGNKYELPCIFLADANDFSLDEIERFIKFLSPSELRKANQFVYEKDRFIAIISRSLLRSLCADYLGVVNEAVVFENNEFGKPFLLNNEFGLSFNVSHSDNLIAFYFDKNNAIGIDVEIIENDFNYEEIIAHYFSDNERTQINSAQGFFRFWTMKEALLKATGVGLIDELNQLEVKEGVNIIEHLPGRLKPFAGKKYLMQSIAHEHFIISLAQEMDADDKFLPGQ